MKNTLENYRRVLSILIGGFGCLCLARAALCTKFFINLSSLLADEFMTNTEIMKLKDVQDLMRISILIFTPVAMVSIVSAIGIFQNKIWSIKVWLFTSIFIFAYNILGFYKNSSDWLQYLSVFILISYSWYILWYIPRKQTEASS